ncbi:MAG: alanine racemase [Spirochaetota bacterium]
MENLPVRRTKALVDLDALASNLRALKRYGADTDMVLAVKADAYGHGRIPVARRAIAEGVAMLAVANAQEFAALRAAGIHHPVIILEDLFPEETAALIDDTHVRFNVSQLSYARMLSQTAVAGGVRARVHVNLDTGMGRMGLLSDDPVGAVREIADLPGLEVEGVFSHFPDADDEDLTLARAQLEAFQQIVSDLEAADLHVRYRHIANSAAIMMFGTEASFDLLRPGVSAYGMYPSTPVAEKMRDSLSLRPCMKLVSSIVKLTTYDREWTVGYGRSYKVGPGSRIAVVPIGYGDGYRRALSNQGTAVVHGTRVPVCGRVSMDMITLDLTDLPEEPRVGDEVVLLGRQSWPEDTPQGATREDSTRAGAAAEGPERGSRTAAVYAEEMAEQIGTISYEITCGFTPRVPRVYSGRRP